jgi:pSer/pThr/pTyr-binding forkhead associated (FHA) protein
VSIEVDTGARPGVLAVESRFAEGEGAQRPGSLLLPTGDRVPLGEFVVSIGRQHDSTIVLGDPNVSRHHAQVRPSGDGFVVEDLGSTNGTMVNGARIAGPRALDDGDEVRFGNTVMRFEAS